MRSFKKVSQEPKSRSAEGREYDSPGYLAIPGSPNSGGGKEERLVVNAAISAQRANYKRAEKNCTAVETLVKIEPLTRLESDVS